MNRETYIPIRKSQINYYKNVPLFYKGINDRFALYKPSGIALSDTRLTEERHPPLYIRQEDRVIVLEDLRKGFHKTLEKNIRVGNVGAVKRVLCDIVEETLYEPRSGSLQALPDIVEQLVMEYSLQPEVLRTLATISMKDYTTVIHSVNVMALTLGFCFHCEFPLNEIKKMGLAALLHDVGKTEIPTELLKANRKLTSDEFKMMKLHTSIGRFIIRENKIIEEVVGLAALEHHERLDGSGYPRGVSSISYIGQLLSIIDCYEALTNEDRPYRRALRPIETLRLLKSESDTGKFNMKIFRKFCYSLVSRR